MRRERWAVDMELKMMTLAIALCCLVLGLGAAPLRAEGQRVRDRFWLFACVAGADNEGWNLKRPSRMTPAEATFYLGLPNLIMVCWEGKPAPPYDQYAIPFRPLKQVVWSVVGSGGETGEKQRGAVFDLARRMPNLTGIFMDDYFTNEGDKVAQLSLEQVRGLRKQAELADRKLDLWVVLYTHQMDRPVREHLRLCDKITLWTWKSEDLKDLEANMDKLDRVAGRAGKLLGLYMYDYGAKGEMPVERMKRQCELGLRWLREGRIEGMIFLANTVADFDFEAVEWTRGWIARVGDEALGKGRR
ncbi:MAG: hypothetical protein JXQ73_13780 [Phycisphaerae bacterium]|nr:hypothetical protein [Phycisphaerae bacterium]